MQTKNRIIITIIVDTLTIKDLLTMSSGIRYKLVNHKEFSHKEAITVDNHAELYLTLAQAAGKYLFTTLGIEH